MESTASSSPPSNASTAPAAKPYFMQGNFAPVDREITLGELTVRGALPPELNGTLLRNGPNPAGAVTETHHWFAGDGMLHAIRLEQGRAVGYRNRYIRTSRIEEVLGLDAAPLSAHSIPMGSGAINVVEHAGHLLAPGEVGLPYEIDREANTVREYDFDGALRSNMTGHPKIDPVSGELLFFGYDFGPVNLRYHVADRSGRLIKTLELPTKAPTMMHDFAVTATRAIFFDCPVLFDLALVARGLKLPFRWNDAYGARVGVMRRDGDGSDLRWIEVPSCYVYHVFNAYDAGRRVVIDLVEHVDAFKDSDPGESVERTKCARWEIDLGTGRFTRTVLDTTSQEFPRIDPRRVTLRHRYGYAVHDPFGITKQPALIKHDFAAGTREAHPLEPACAPSEGVFAPTGQGEDEGYVIAPVWNPMRGASDVYVIDAQRWTDDPVAIIELPVRIPFGFHGDFIPNL